MVTSDIDMLRNAPAHSVDFKITLAGATNTEIMIALSMMGGKPWYKGKIAACSRELRKRGCDDFEKGI